MNYCALFDGPEMTGVSLVPASRCRECGTRMDACSATHWACPKEGCSKRGEPVYTGVHSLKSCDDPEAIS